MAQPAHQSPDFAELVCSNSLRSNVPTSAVGLLKEEMRRLGSLVLRTADETALPAGRALAVDRVGFARRMTEADVRRFLRGLQDDGIGANGLKSFVAAIKFLYRRVVRLPAAPAVRHDRDDPRSADRRGRGPGSVVDG